MLNKSLCRSFSLFFFFSEYSFFQTGDLFPFPFFGLRSVIYKEQLRLNQAASSALMARLEAQKAICDASEKELHKKYKQRDELETQIRPEWEQARKRSRMDDALAEERESKTVLYLPASKPRTVLHKELRVFLEEEQKASNAALSQSEEDRKIEVNEELERPTKRLSIDNLEEKARYIDALEDENLIENKMRTLEIEERNHKFQFPVLREPDIEEDEESRKQRGKGNVEKWLQILLDSSPEELGPQNENESEIDKTGDIIRKMNLKYPQEVKNLKRPEAVVKKGVPVNESIVQEKDGNAHKLDTPVRGVVSRKSFEGKERRDQSNGKERKLARSESARAFRRIPSSPSIILGMKKGVDCIRKKPMVTSDDEESYATENNFIKSSMKTIKKAVKL